MKCIEENNSNDGPAETPSPAGGKRRRRLTFAAIAVAAIAIIAVWIVPQFLIAMFSGWIGQYWLGSVQVASCRYNLLSRTVRYEGIVLSDSNGLAWLSADSLALVGDDSMPSGRAIAISGITLDIHVGKAMPLSITGDSSVTRENFRIVRADDIAINIFCPPGIAAGDTTEGKYAGEDLAVSIADLHIHSSWVADQPSWSARLYSNADSTLVEGVYMPETSRFVISDGRLDSLDMKLARAYVPLRDLRLNDIKIYAGAIELADCSFELAAANCKLTASASWPEGDYEFSLAARDADLQQIAEMIAADVKVAGRCRKLDVSVSHSISQSMNAAGKISFELGEMDFSGEPATNMLKLMQMAAVGSGALYNAAGELTLDYPRLVIDRALMHNNIIAASVQSGQVDLPNRTIDAYVVMGQLDSSGIAAVDTVKNSLAALTRFRINGSLDKPLASLISKQPVRDTAGAAADLVTDTASGAGGLVLDAASGVWRMVSPAVDAITPNKKADKPKDVYKARPAAAETDEPSESPSDSPAASPQVSPASSPAQAPADSPANSPDGGDK